MYRTMTNVKYKRGGENDRKIDKGLNVSFRDECW